MSASLSVSVSLPLPSLSPRGPEGLRSTDAHQRRGRGSPQCKHRMLWNGSSRQHQMAKQSPQKSPSASGAIKFTYVRIYCRFYTSPSFLRVYFWRHVVQYVRYQIKFREKNDWERLPEIVPGLELTQGDDWTELWTWAFWIFQDNTT